MTNDERLIIYLLQKSKNGYAIISVFNPDFTKKNRKNSKQAKKLQELIIESGFYFKSFSYTLPNGEIKIDYLVFEKYYIEDPDDEDYLDDFQEKDIKLNKFLDTCKQTFNNFTVQYDIENYLRDKSFYHPLLKSDKDEYIKRKELILTDLFEPPQTINNFHVQKAISETEVVYECGNILCIIKLLEDGSWVQSFGTVRPVGANIKTDRFTSREEAFSNIALPQ